MRYVICRSSDREVMVIRHLELIDALLKQVGK